MRSYQIIAWGEPLEPRDYPDPEPVGTEVLVRIDASGVCHSDLHIWSGAFDMGEGKRVTAADRGVAPPFTMGHEIVGEVVALGPEAEGTELGDRRIVFPWIGCRACAVCACGDDNLCATPRFLGARVDGGYSDHVLVPDAKYLIDYEGLPTGLACTYACSGITAYGATKKLAGLTEDDHYLIIGAGGVGHNAVHLAPAMVPATLLVADIDATKRSVARQAGAADTIDNAESDAAAKVLALSGGGVGGVIDFVGSPETFRLGTEVLRRGGTLVSVGLYGGAGALSLPKLPFMSMTVRGSYVGTLAEMHELMALVKAGKVPPIPIESRPLAEVNGALEDLAAGRVVGRVVLTPERAADA